MAYGAGPGKTVFVKRAPQGRQSCSFPDLAFNLSHQLSYFAHVPPALCFPNFPSYCEISARSNIRRSPRFLTRTSHLSVSRILVQHPSLLDTSFKFLGRLCRNVDRCPTTYDMRIAAASKMSLLLSSCPKSLPGGEAWSIAPLAQRELICITDRRISPTLPVEPCSLWCEVHVQHLMKPAYRIRQVTRGRIF